MSHHDDFERFRYYVLPFNQSGKLSIPLVVGTPTTIAQIRIHSDCNDVVSLLANVGWTALTNGTGLSSLNVLFKIWRGPALTGLLVYSAIDSSERGFDNNKLTTLAHVDKNFRFSEHYTYTLTAELVDAGSSATIIGPITFTATEIGLGEG